MKKLTLGLLLLASSLVNAETFFKDQSLSLLQGSDYETGFDSTIEKRVVTYEYFSVHDWGDVFGFVDRLINVDDGGSETYIELSPNFNIATFESGFINSIKVATTWEMVSIGDIGATPTADDSADNFLVGLGAGFNVPGFSYLNASLYHRFNDATDDNQQLTITWGLPFNIAGQDFLFDGFWDITNEINGVDTSNLTPQLKWDISKLVGYDGKLYAGIEYVNWTNKLYFDGTDESNVNLLIKAHF